MVIQGEVGIEYAEKTDAEKGGGLGKGRHWLTKGGGGVREMLTFAEKGGGGVQTPLFLADIICEQPLKPG